MVNVTRSKSARKLLRRKPGLVLFAVLIVLGVGVTFAERFRPEAVEPLRRSIATGLSAYFRPLLEVTRDGRSLALRVFNLWGVEGDYREIRRRLMYTEAELQLAQEQLRRLGRIEGMRDWRSSREIEFILADVIGFSTKGGSAEWIINRGADDEIEVGLPVVGLRGLAGIVREVHERTAVVQSLTDPKSAVGVAAMETRNRGILFGRGSDAPLEFIPESEDQPIVPGTVLITSGLENSVYPKGLIVGTIQGRRSNFRGVDFGMVEPAESFNAVEEVLVLQRQRPVGPVRPMQGMGTLYLDMSGSRFKTEDVATSLGLLLGAAPATTDTLTTASEATGAEAGAPIPGQEQPS